MDFHAQNDNGEVVTYRTEDRVEVKTGDRVYNYYDMEPGHIGRDTGDGWFYFIAENTEGRGLCLLNGDRICTIAFARRRGFKGV